jgi:penicillin G amidase
MEEEPVRRILEERPEHLLPPGYDSWNDVLSATWVETVDRMAASGLRTPWGESNSTTIVHPLAQAMPFLAKSLNMPEEPQGGHPFAVRVATPTFGASARMVVSPGREDRGILHTPAGQSGNYLSPHYRDSHRYWLEGRPLPFAVNNPSRELRLVPSSEPRP